MKDAMCIVLLVVTLGVALIIGYVAQEDMTTCKQSLSAETCAHILQR